MANSQVKYFGPTHFGNAVDKATKVIFRNKDFNIVKLIIEWHHIIPKYAKCSTPINIIKHNKTLHLGVINSSLLFTMQYDEQNIIKKINQYFDSEIVKKIKFNVSK